MGGGHCPSCKDAAGRGAAYSQGVEPQVQVEPNLITFNAGISACEKGWQWEQALAILERHEDEPEVLPSSVSQENCDLELESQRCIQLMVVSGCEEPILRISSATMP